LPAAQRPGESDGHHPELLQVIGDEIRDSGPLPFSRFQELCLYHPHWGYYTRGRGIGRQGADFWTAPEMNPVFGELVAVQLTEMSSLLGNPGDFQVVELGAGTGRMALAALDAWRRDASPWRKKSVRSRAFIKTPSTSATPPQRCSIRFHSTSSIRFKPATGTL
jgi:hypothetical protein